MTVLAFWRYSTSSGLVIRVIRPGVHVPSAPGMQALLIWVEPDQRGKEPRLFVDSRPVPWQDLNSVLQRDIVRRPLDWPIYVGGDERMEFGQVAKVIDAVRGLRATVVLLTRRSAQENATVH